MTEESEFQQHEYLNRKRLENTFSHRRSRPEIFCKKGFLRNFAKTLGQVFSCEFCEISKNTFFIEHLW